MYLLHKMKSITQMKSILVHKIKNVLSIDLAYIINKL